jgi:hypothetical protein
MGQQFVHRLLESIAKKLPITIMVDMSPASSNVQGNAGRKKIHKSFN